MTASGVHLSLGLANAAPLQRKGCPTSYYPPSNGAHVHCSIPAAS